MCSGLGNFNALEGELSERLESKIATFNTKEWYGSITVFLFGVMVFLIIGATLSSLVQQIETDINILFPSMAWILAFPLFGGFVALAALIVFVYLNTWLISLLRIHNRPRWIWWIWLYVTLSVGILLMMAYQTRPFTFEAYLPQFILWFPVSGILLGASFIFVNFGTALMPRVSWLWLLSVAKTNPDRYRMLPSYMEVVNQTTNSLTIGTQWDKAMWETIRSTANNRLSAANAHTQAASFILVSIGFIGILPTVADRAWQNMVALGSGYFQSFATTKEQADPELWVQSLVVLFLLTIAVFTLRYFALEAWHLRLAEMIIYLADERLRDMPPPPPPTLPPPSAPSASFSSFLIGAGVTAIMVWLVKRIRS